MIWDSSSFGWGLEGTKGGGPIRSLPGPSNLPKGPVFPRPSL